MPYTAFSTSGIQAQVQINGNYTNIPGCTSISISGGEKQKIEATALSDTSPVYLAGQASEITASMPLNWDPRDTVHQYLKTRNDASSVADNFKVIMPWSGANNAMSFAGSITAFTPNLERNSPGQAQLAVVLSSSWTI